MAEKIFKYGAFCYMNFIAVKLQILISVISTNQDGLP